MWRYLKPLLALAVVLASGAVDKLSATDGASPVADVARDAGATVLVIGDSISAGYGIQAQESWVHLLRERLGDQARVVNASISGDTTGGGLARLPKTLSVHEPQVVIIELGGNDGLRGFPVANIRANLLAMTEAVLAIGAKPVLAGMRIPPNYGPSYTHAFHTMYAEVAEATGAALVPFLLEGVATDRELMQDDGIHPTAPAQQRLLDNIWPVLQPLIGSDSD